jgi:hypothetical protein
MKYSGIDLHSNNSVVTVTDDNDHVVVAKRLPNDLAKIVGLLEPWREELMGVVVESTYNWYWLVDGLKQSGCPFVCFLPGQFPQHLGEAAGLGVPYRFLHQA